MKVQIQVDSERSSEEVLLKLRIEESEFSQGQKQGWSMRNTLVKYSKQKDLCSEDGYPILST